MGFTGNPAFISLMATYPLSNEQELLFGIARGEERAFKTVYYHYCPLVYAFSLKYLKSHDRAEEVVQEIFLKLWRMGQQLRQIKNLENFLLAMSRNRSIDHLRQMKLETVHQDFLRHEIGDYCNSTEEVILLKETNKIVEKGITLLPTQQKLVYTLCRTEGRPHSEVARELQLSPETVKRHMKLALRFLRSYVASHTDLTLMLVVFNLI